MKTSTNGKTYKVAGVTHYADNIMSLSLENENYFKSKRALIDEGLIDERVWQYEFYPEKVELIPEPENPEDPKAIKVIVDDEHVGYIKRGSCSHIHKLLKEDCITGISCTIGGGPYKYISEEYDDEKDKDVYILEKGETQLFVHLQIAEKSDVPEPDAIQPEEKSIEVSRPAEPNTSNRIWFGDDEDDGIKRTYCINCGKEVGNALRCPFCGTRTENHADRVNSPVTSADQSPKNKWIAFLLCFFLGGIGAHRFYAGKIGTGILYLFTAGCFGIGTLIDLILILCGTFTDEDGLTLV